MWESSAVHYSERLHPSPLVLVLLAALAASFGLIFVPLSPVVAGLVAAGLAGLAVAVLIATAPSIEVSGGELRAGDAHIPGWFLGDVEALGRPELRAVMGTDADARAFVVHRPWAAGAVRVAITDPRDPTPYWLISSRRPAELALAIEALEV